MRALHSTLASLALLAMALLGGCVTQTPYDYTAFKQSRPHSILILPPVNDSPAVEASYTVLSTLSFPLGESGYYVVPVALAAETFRQNGLSNPADVETVSIAKLRQIFGADAALYTHVKAYGTVYKVVTSESVVTVEGRLVDLRTGAELWKGSASASSAEGRGNSGGGVIGLLVTAVVQQVMENTMDQSRKMAPISSARLLTAGSPRGVLYGPRSAKYDGTDPAIVASAAPAPANTSLKTPTSAAADATPTAAVMTADTAAVPAAATTTAVVVADSPAPALPESAGSCQRLIAPGINCVISSDAAGNSQLRVQVRDQATSAALNTEVKALVTAYCSEAKRSDLNGNFALEEQQHAVETDFSCTGGAWSVWKPVTHAGG